MHPARVTVARVLTSLRFWLSSWPRQQRASRELQDEMRFHEEMLVSEGLAAGLSPSEARDAARRRFGNATQFREQSSDVWTVALLDNALADARFAVRALRRHPLANGVVVALLALGIGAASAALAVVRATARPLAVEQPEQLVLLRRTVSGGKATTREFPPPVFDAMRDDLGQLDGLIAHDYTRLNVRLGSTTESAHGRIISGNVFALLGVRALIGRTLLAADDAPGRSDVAVLSHGFWTRRLGADPAAVGRSISINGRPFSVVGVLPEKFPGLSAGRSPEDIWVPLSTRGTLALRDHPDVAVLGRLATGATIAGAEAELTARYRGALARGVIASPRNDSGARVTLSRALHGEGGLASALAGSLHLAFGIAIVILLVVCANVAGLLIVRAHARQREIGIRLAIGVSRARLIQQLLIEAIVTAALGGAAGALFGWWGSRVLVTLLAPNPETLMVDLAPNWRGIGFVILLCAGVAVLCGLVPARFALGIDPRRTLRAGEGRGLTAGRSSSRLRRALVVVQLGLALVLLMDGALLTDAITSVARTSPGFDRAALLHFWTFAATAGYSGEREQTLYRQVAERLAATPGVRAASFARRQPGLGFALNECAPPPRAGEPAGVAVNAVGPGFFATMGIPLLQGREIAWSDTRNAAPVVVVSQSVANDLFAGDAVGRMLRFDGGLADGAQIIGVVGTMRHYAISDRRGLRDGCDVYVPVGQATTDMLGQMTFVVRAEHAPAEIAAEVRRAVNDVDRNLAVVELQPLSETVRRYYQREESLARFALVFSAVAAAIAALGLYGVLAYGVAARTREIGIRMALGASPAETIRLVLGETMRLVLIGLGLGCIGALLSTRLLGAFAFGLSALRPGPVAAALGVLAATALAACYLPARRAAMVDSLVALRGE